MCVYKSVFLLLFHAASTKPMWLKFGKESKPWISTGLLFIPKELMIPAGFVKNWNGRGRLLVKKS